MVTPLLQKVGVPGTFFVLDPESWWGDRVHSYVKVSDIQLMASAGMDIQSHGISHKNLTTIQGSVDYWNDLNISRIKIGEVLDKEITVFCYPFGAHNAQVRVDTLTAGYLGAFSTDVGNLNTLDMLYRILRRRPS